VKVVSQRKTAAVDHHHPLRPLAPLGFSDSAAPFFAGAKLPSRNDSLHCNCRRSFNSLRNVRQMFNQTPRSGESTESLPTHGGFRSTGDRPCVAWGLGEQGRNFLPLRLGQQRTRSGHRPSLGAAHSAYLSSQKTHLLSFQAPVLGYATA
jgi:hypothetical protein